MSVFVIPSTTPIHLVVPFEKNCAIKHFVGGKNDGSTKDIKTHENLIKTANYLRVLLRWDTGIGERGQG